MARLEQLAADGARTTDVLLRLVSHVPNLAATINGEGPAVLNLTASATPDNENPAVRMVAGELAAGKRIREDGSLNPEADALEEQDEELRELMEEEVEKLRQLKLRVKPTMEDMEVDPREDEEAAGGGLKLIGMHGAMEMGGNTLCPGYSGYSYNNRRVGDEDGWRRYEERGRQVERATTAIHPWCGSWC